MAETPTIQIKLEKDGQIQELVFTVDDAISLVEQLSKLIKLKPREDGTIPTDQMKVPKPDVRILKSKIGTVEEHLMQAPQPVPFIERIEYPEDGGVFVYHKGFKYPIKGFPYPEACQAVNIIKRMLMGQVRYLARFPVGVLPLLTRRGLNKWLRELASAGEIALSPYFLEEIRYQKSVREIIKFIKTFLLEIGIDGDVASMFSEVMGMLFEYDNAYLFILQDLMTESTKEKLLKNPATEFARLVKILHQRDGRESMRTRFNSFKFLVRIIMLVPRLRKAYRKALENIIFENIQMDEGDKYQTLRWTSYNFGGRTLEERGKKFVEIHEGNLPPVLIVRT